MKKIIMGFIFAIAILILPATKAYAVSDVNYLQFITQTSCISGCGEDVGRALIQDGTTYKIQLYIPQACFDAPNIDMGNGEPYCGAISFNMDGNDLTATGGYTQGSDELGSNVISGSNNYQFWGDYGTLTTPTDIYITFTGTGTGSIEAFDPSQYFAFSYHYYTPIVEQVQGVSTEATQLVVNGVVSVKDTLTGIVAIVWPYALGVLLFFLVLRFGMRFFRH